MIPHPVQIIKIIRICDEEGKLFIISVIAIVFVIHGRLVDVVTSKLEWAIRDEKEQRDYYKFLAEKRG